MFFISPYEKLLTKEEKNAAIKTMLDIPIIRQSDACIQGWASCCNLCCTFDFGIWHTLAPVILGTVFGILSFIMSIVAVSSNAPLANISVGYK
jgi:hypothetical protein